MHEPYFLLMPVLILGLWILDTFGTNASSVSKKVCIRLNPTVKLSFIYKIAVTNLIIFR